MQRGGCIYIMTNVHHSVFYVGMTSNLYNRVHQYKYHHFKNSFTDKYNAEVLVYYEGFSRIEEAITREKIVKKWNRQKKIDLINSFNPGWKDLWEDVSKW
jgi:putative endonuclease